MTVQMSTSKTVYYGDGVTTEFPITFEIGKPEYIHVYIRKGDNAIYETNSYDLEDNYIIYPSEEVTIADSDELDETQVLTEDDSIVITRELPLKQEMNLVNQGPFFAESIESAFDDTVMMIQQVNEKVGRALTVDLDNTENPNTVIGEIFTARTQAQASATSAYENAQNALQSEQSAGTYKTMCEQYKTATDANKTSVAQTKQQIDTISATVSGYKDTTLEYMTMASTYASNARASELNTIAKTSAAETASATATTKASEAGSYKAQAEAAADEAEASKNLAYEYLNRGLSVPIGTIIPFAGNGTLPIGFLLCDGSSVSKAQYGGLFDVIGYTYGGSGNNFNLPDLTDRFIEGSDESIGEYLDAGLPNIEGTLSNIRSADGADSSSSGSLEFSATTTYPNTVTSRTGRTYYDGITLDASSSSAIYGNSSTVQPAALCLRYIIRAFAGATEGNGDITALQESKQDKLTAGTNISITNNTISATSDSTKVNVTNPSMQGTPTIRLNDLNKNGNTESVWGTGLVIADKDGNWFSQVKAENHGWNNSNYLGFTLNHTNHNATIGLTIKSDGTAYAEAPTPSSTANGYEITTASWVNDKLSTINATNAAQSAEIVKLQRKTDAIWDMGNNIFYKFETDTNAGNKTIPSGAKLCDINYGGKSFVANQLASLTNTTSTTNGITTTISNGKVTHSGTCTASFQSELQTQVPIIANHKYLLIDLGTKYPISTTITSTALQIYNSNVILLNTNETSTVNMAIGSATGSGVATLRHRFQQDATYNLEYYPMLVDLTQMFGSGNEPTLDECKQIFTEYIPYNAGTLTNQSVEIVKIRGRNIVNIADTTFTGTKSINLGFELEIGKTYIFSCDFSGGTSGKTPIIYPFYNGISAGSTHNLIVNTSGRRWADFIPTTKVNQLMLYASSGWADSQGVSCTYSNIQLEENSSATSYSPYKLQSITIPTDWAELKSAGSVYDERQFYSVEQTDGTTKYYCKYIKRVGDTVVDNQYTVLETPVVTTIELSENLFENITVEGNGSIEFCGTNDYNMPIPNTETYLIALAEV